MIIDVSDYTELWKCNEASGALLGVNGYNWAQSGPTLDSVVGQVEDPVSSILGRGDLQPIGGTSAEIYLYDSTAGDGDLWDVQGAVSCTFAGWLKLQTAMTHGYWYGSLYEIAAANKQAFRMAPWSAMNPIFRMFDGISSFNEKTVRANGAETMDTNVWQFVGYGYDAATNKIFCFWGKDVGEYYYNTADGFAAGFGYSVQTGAHLSRFLDGAGQGINQKNYCDQLFWWQGRALTEAELEFLWNDHAGRAADDLIGESIIPSPTQYYYHRRR